MNGALLKVSNCNFMCQRLKAHFTESFGYALFLLIEYLALQIDIHLHCDEWDRALDEGNWEPQQIASKLPNFLQFLRNVQQNVSPRRSEPP